jgi:hypothetical protein
LQFRDPTTGQLVSFGRDILHCWLSAVGSVSQAFNRRYWPSLTEMGVALGRNPDGSPMTEDQFWDALEVANRVFYDLLAECCRNTDETFDQLAERVGWTAVADPVRFVWCAMLGAVGMGMLWDGLRDVSLAGEVPPAVATPLMQHCFAMARRRVEGHRAYEGAIQDLTTAVLLARIAGAGPAEIDQCVLQAKVAHVDLPA